MLFNISPTVISGFSANEDNSSLLNKEGEAVTRLRPSGIALIDSKRVDVVTDGEFLEAGAKVHGIDIDEMVNKKIIWTREGDGVVQIP